MQMDTKNLYICELVLKSFYCLCIAGKKYFAKDQILEDAYIKTNNQEL